MKKVTRARREVFNITKRFVDALPLPPADEPNGERYYDDDLRGFGINVYPSGKKTFFIEYGPAVHRRRMKIGTYGQLTVALARELAAQKLAEIVQGDDPLEDRKQKAEERTFSMWVDSYIERVTPRKKHVRDDVRYLGEAKQHWGSWHLGEITAEEIERRVSEKRKEISNVTANRWLASVRSCLQDAWRQGIIEQNPAMRVRGFPENPPRARVLTEDELLCVLKAIDALPSQHMRAAFYILIQTGARLSELLHAKWEDVDLENRIWRIPSPKAGKPQFVPLPDEIVATLQHLPHKGDYLIPGQRKGKPRTTLRDQWEELLAAAKVEKVNIHDLRRTFGLHMSRKAGLHVASKLLRHSDIRVTEKHYAPLGLDELRKALNERGADVVTMRKKKEEEEKAEERKAEKAKKKSKLGG